MADDPRVYCKALAGNLAGLWRYRVGILAKIEETHFVILVVHVGHRKNV